jgi:epoxyqueuosine reductase
LNDDDPVIRDHAARALGRIGGGDSGAALEARLAIEEDSKVASEIRAALDCVAA